MKFNYIKMTKHYLAYKIPSDEFTMNDIVPGSNMKICPCGEFVFVIVGKYSSSTDMLSIKKSNLSSTNDLYRNMYPFEVYSFSKSKRSDNHCYTCHCSMEKHVDNVEEIIEEEIIDIEICIDFFEDNVKKNKKRNNKKKNNKKRNNKKRNNKKRNNQNADVKKVSIDIEENEISSDEFKKEILDYELDQIKMERDSYYDAMNK
jgi:hypothetical protein